MKRFLSYITALTVAVTMIIGSVTAVYSAEADEGGLLWYYKNSSGTSMTGVSAPVVDGEYVYMASGRALYKFNADTGDVVGEAELTGSIGYNKLAVTVADGKVFVPLGGAKLDIVEASTMTRINDESIVYAEGQTSHQSLTPVVYSESDESVYLGSWRKGAGGTYAKISLSDFSVTKITDSDTGFYWSGACDSGGYIVFGSTSDGDDDPNTPSDGDAVLYAYDKSKSPDVDGAVLRATLKGSGSIFSTVVSYNGRYYFTSKAGRLYEASVTDGILKAEVKADLSEKTTCTPVISDAGRAYIGTAANVQIINLEIGQAEASYSVPADVKFLKLSGDKIYCTYNNKPGGIYVISAAAGTGNDYFIPHSSMQNYCISSIAEKDGTLYFTNDSNNLMAVRDSDELITAGWNGADSSGSIADKAYTGSAQKPKLTVQYGGQTLTEKNDKNDNGYTAEYTNNIYPGTATVVVKGTGCYKGTVILNFTIKKPVVAAQKNVTSQLYGYDDIQVKWDTQIVKGTAVYYKVEYKKSGGSWQVLAGGTSGSSIKKANLTDGAGYYFRVTPYVKVNGKTYSGTSKASSIVYTLKKLNTPSVKKSSKQYVKISWKNISGESGYQIARSSYKTKKFSVVKTVSYKYSSCKLKASANKTYYYKIRAYKTVNGDKIFGPWSSVRAYKLK